MLVVYYVFLFLNLVYILQQSSSRTRSSSPVPESSDIGASSPLRSFEDESEIIPQGEPLQIDNIEEEEDGEELFGDNLEA